MTIALSYVDAVESDFLLLTETAIASKKYWGYSEELLNLWKHDLEISKEYIQKNKVVKVYSQDGFIGFFGLKREKTGIIEIDHLWIKPNEIKKGYGRQIFAYIRNYLLSKGEKVIRLVAEPNAKEYYNKMGGRIIGQIESKLSGRFLDIYEYVL